MISLLEGNGYLVYLAGIAGLLHACLQMPAATLLHMTGHALGRKQRSKAFALSIAMSLGVFLTIGLLLVIASQINEALSSQHRHLFAGILTVFAGLFVMLRYFRDTVGAQLWLPRKRIRWFHKQIEQTANIFGAFGMGIIAVLSELGLSFPLLLCVSAVLLDSGATTVVAGLSVYATIVTFPLLVIGVMLATGSSPLTLQRWRIDGRRFWQFFIGLAFIIFGLYIASGQFTYAAEALGAVL